MQKDARLKVLLLLLLLVFVLALYVIVQNISSHFQGDENNLGTDPAFSEEESTGAPIAFSLSGTITAVKDQSVTVHNFDKIKVVLPGPTPETATTMNAESALTVTLTEKTQYENITREEMQVGKRVLVDVEQNSEDATKYSALVVRSFKGGE